MLSSCDNSERCFCWNGDDDALEKCIRRNKFVKTVRSELMKKKFKSILPNVIMPWNTHLE